MEAVAKKNEGQVQANEHKAEKTAEFKAKKAEAAKAFAERQKERKALMVELCKEIKEKNLLDKFSPKSQEFINGVLNPVARTSGFGGQTFLNKVFGETPKVGDSITLIDYMKKTFKAKADLDKKVKEWSEKGIIVEYNENKADLLKSTYTIKKL